MDVDMRSAGDNNACGAGGHRRIADDLPVADRDILAAGDDDALLTVTLGGKVVDIDIVRVRPLQSEAGAGSETRPDVRQAQPPNLSALGAVDLHPRGRLSP